MGKQSIGRSYDYSVLCDSCKFKFKNYELRLRWDGLWVCKDDWELRHPSDFYRNRNDTHKLPFTRSDDGIDPTLHWTGSISATTSSLKGTETVTNPQGDYYLDTLNGRTSGNIALFLFGSSQGLTLAFPQSTTTNGGGSINLPTTPTTGGMVIVSTSYGILTKANVSAGSANVVIPAWTAKPGNLYLSFSYGT